MAGYDGYSMSNNAVAAYEDGEAPASEVARRIGRGATAKAVAEVLPRSSWHHTSKMYNCTNFYDLDAAAHELASDAIHDVRKIGWDGSTVERFGRQVPSWMPGYIDPLGCQIERAKRWICAQIIAKAREIRGSK
jgi:hypothetical protein